MGFLLLGVPGFGVVAVAEGGFGGGVLRFVVLLPRYLAVGSFLVAFWTDG